MLKHIWRRSLNDSLLIKIVAGVLTLYLCVQIECPEFPEDLKHWISFISASSQALRAESGLEEKNK